MFANHGTGVGVDDNDDVAKTGRYGVRSNQINHGFAVHTNGSQRLDTAEAASASRGQNYENGPFMTNAPRRSPKSFLHQIQS